MHVVKLGGSVITEKREETYVVKKQTLSRLVREIRRGRGECIVVHGAGTFGHKRVRELASERDNAMKISLIQQSTRGLNRTVLEVMLDDGLRPVSFPPYALFRFSGGKVYKKNFLMMREYLTHGFTPVVYGDICLDPMHGSHICSGDESMVELTNFFKPEIAIFVADVDGIYDRDPADNGAKLIRELDRDAAPSFGNRREDVTGGMEKKYIAMREISKVCRTLVLNGHVHGRLLKAIRGERVISSEVR